MRREQEQKIIPYEDLRFAQVLSQIRELFPGFNFTPELRSDMDERTVWYVPPGNRKGEGLSQYLYEEAVVGLAKELADCQLEVEWRDKAEREGVEYPPDMSYLTKISLIWDRAEEILNQLGLDNDKKLQMVFQEKKEEAEEVAFEVDLEEEDKASTL